MVDLSASMKKIVNVSEEIDEKLVEFANKNNVIMVALIAPYTRVKISPIEEASAFIGLSEEFGVETAIREIKKKAKNTDKVFILLNSRGGAVDSSYKIAKCLRDNFKHITIFIPHIAASGGTLVALTGNEIVMGIMSHLSPVDVQTDYGENGNSVSMTAMFKSFDAVEKYFEKLQAEEAPYPWTSLAKKFDPVTMFDWKGVLDAMYNYTTEILIKSGYDKDKADLITKGLIWDYPSHDCVIDYEQAKALGINVRKDSDYKEMWELMRMWLEKYMLEATDKHVIRFIVPNNASLNTDIRND